MTSGAFVLAALLALEIPVFAPSEADAARVVARVGTGEVRLADLARSVRDLPPNAREGGVRPALVRKVLDQVIRERAIAAWISRTGFAESPAGRLACFRVLRPFLVPRLIAWTRGADSHGNRPPAPGETSLEVALDSIYRTERRDSGLETDETTLAGLRRPTVDRPLPENAILFRTRDVEFPASDFASVFRDYFRENPALARSGRAFDTALDRYLKETMLARHALRTPIAATVIAEHSTEVALALARAAIAATGPAYVEPSSADLEAEIASHPRRYRRGGWIQVSAWALPDSTEAGLLGEAARARSAAAATVADFEAAAAEIGGRRVELRRGQKSLRFDPSQPFPPGVPDLGPRAVRDLVGPLEEGFVQPVYLRVDERTEGDPLPERERLETARSRLREERRLARDRSAVERIEAEVGVERFLDRIPYEKVTVR